MNNDNNLNGNVIGNVNSTNTMPNSTPNINNEIETLDVLGGSEPNNAGQQAILNNTNNNQVATPTNNMAGGNTMGPSNPMPEPAFTNPQNINPMPGFENSNIIGTPPPANFEPDKQPKKKTHKFIFIIIVLILLAAVGFGTYYILKYTNILNLNNSVKIEPKDIEFNIGDVLSDSVQDYANITGTDIKNCSINLNEVRQNIDKEGTYKFIVECGETQATGNFVIKDNKEIEVDLLTVVKAKNETVEAKEFIKDEEELTIEFVDESKVQEILQGENGIYDVDLTISNGSKTKDVKGQLVIIDYPVKGYLTCSKEEDKNNYKLTTYEKFAISLDSAKVNVYGGFAQEIFSLEFNSESDYANYVATYKSSNTLTIDDMTGPVAFDNTKKTITFTNILDNEEVYNRYSQDNIKTYRTIIDYFKGQKYTCIYE